MSGHLSPDTAPRNPMRNERGNSTRLLLLVLLLVVAAGGYLYFFTDLIRPVKEAAKPAVVQTAQVKKPIPPRPGQPGAPGESPAKPAEAKPSPGAPPAAPAPPRAKQAAAPAKPEPAKVAKMAKAEVPQKPTATGTSAPAKPAAAPPKLAAAPAPAKPAAQPKVVAAPAAAKPAPKVAKRAVKGKGGPFALQVGDFVPDKALEIQAKLKKSGIVPVKIAAVTAPETMNRLEVAQFTDQDAAEAELQKLKQLTADAFMVADSGTYSLYAGSYLT
jgi:cell division protein FtsN